MRAVPVRSRLRVLRAALFAAVCVALALAGHAFVSDGPVQWWAPPSALAMLTAAAWAAGGRERGLPGICVSLVGAQFVLHSLFGWAQHPHAHHELTPDQIERQWLSLLLCDEHALLAPEHGHSAARLLAGMGLDPALATRPPGHVVGSGGTGAAHDAVAASGSSGAHTATEMLFPGHMSSGMLLAHLVAGVGSAVWLWRGERAVFDLLRLSAARAASLAGLIRAWLRWGEPSFPLVAPLRPVPAPVVAPWVCRPLTRRGPPVLSGA